ncbi:MAG: hypothetical protein OEO19_09180 [Gammaproteobacteria bacterium]|nr:hypothetical protein [Gammaproteobacteria bacterium]MDH3448364.1 hypothetical protein [Gammaproteobacteria bacterium]
MKSTIKGLLLGLGLSSSLVNADFLGDADDSYIGFRMTTSLDASARGVFSGRNEYSYLLIDQRDGIKSGLSFTQDSNGDRMLGYLGPSTTFDIGKTSILDSVIPIVRLDAQANSDSERSSSAAGVGMVALLFVVLKLKQDLESDWKPAN